MRPFQLHRLVCGVLLLCSGPLGCTVDSTGEGARTEDEPVAEVSQADVPLGAAEVAGILVSLEEGVLLQAQIAEQSCFAPAVRAFAAKLLEDNKAARQALVELLSAAQLHAADTALSRSIAARLQLEASILRGLEPRSFDSAYLHLQVDEHRRALRLIDGTLMAAAQGTRMVPLLRDARGMIAGHLDQAMSLLRGQRPSYPRFP